MLGKEQLPNIISATRLIVSIPLLSLLYQHGLKEWFLVAAASLALTDLLDGWLAKTFGWTTWLGKVLDPMADKVWAWTMKIIVLAEHNLLEALQWPLVIFAIYDGGTFLMRWFVVESANDAARVKTALLMLALLALCAGLFDSTWKETLVGGAYVTLQVASVLTLISAAIYIRRHVRIKAFT